MKYSNINVISCFYILALNNEHYINCTVFNPENNFNTIQSSITKTKGITNIYSIKSEIMKVEGNQKL